jgi:hypothetical protein
MAGPDCATWSVKALKAECARHGVSCEGCTEKIELIRLCESLPSPALPSSSSPKPPPEQPASDDGPGSEHVRRVLCLAPNDYYGILGLARSADGEALKKAYRHLALHLHPDKCHVQGADEAFKRVGAAFAVLRDKRKRAEYDLGGGAAAGGFGGGGGGPSHSGVRRGHAAGANAFGDRDAEELFRAFFGDTDEAWSWGAAPASGGSSSLTPAGSMLARANNLVALGRRLLSTFTHNPWTLITLLSGLASLANIIDSLASIFGGWALALIPIALCAGYICPPAHRVKIGGFLLMLLVSGCF